MNMHLKLANVANWAFPALGLLLGLFSALSQKDFRSDWRYFVVLGAIGLVAGFILRTGRFLKFGGIELELQPIRDQRKVIEERLKESTSDSSGPDILNVVQLGLNQLTEYYTINKSQARNSFTASLAAVVLGFITLVAAYFLALRSRQVATVTALSGILLQFLGGAYFYLYNKSLQQLNFFYGELVKLQDTMLAIKLCDELGEGKDRVREGLIMALLQRPFSRAPSDEFRSARKKAKSKVAQTETTQQA
jgi:MFS family permease